MRTPAALCARCFRTRRSSPSASAASISFATFRRAPISGTRLPHSSSSLRRHAKPVFLHQRDAHAEFLEIVAPRRARLAGGVAHCFTGGPEELEAYLDLDLHIGVTGWVCDERRGAKLRESLPHIPLERLLIETDAPYLVPRDLVPQPRGRRNEPKFLAHILERVAAEMNRSADEVAAATTANAERLFRLR